MATTKKQGLGSAKRFGTRYGRKLKLRVAELEKAKRDSNKCPYCHKPKVKRLTAGIWNCGKCGAKFTGRAYSVRKKVAITEAKGEEAKEEMEEIEAAEVSETEVSDNQEEVQEETTEEAEAEPEQETKEVA